MSQEQTREAVLQGLLDGIRSGTYEPGKRLPSESALARQHNVHRGTARAALAALEAQGLLYAVKGSGWYVREYRPLYWHLSRFELGERRDDPDTGTDEWAADMREQRRTPRQEVTVSTETAPVEVADYLRLPVGSSLVRRRRLRFADDIPVSIADTWLPEDIAHRTCTVGGKTVQPFMVEDDIAIPGGIVAAVGIRQKVADDQIMARMPTASEMELLDIKTSGTPVLDHVRVGIDDTGRRIRALISVSPGDRLYLRYQLDYRNGDSK